MFFPFTLVDLTHSLTPLTPAWDEHEQFHLQTTFDYADCTTDVKFRVQTMQSPVGIGTHMDAPSHCTPGGTTIEQLPLDQLIAPCVMIDVSDRAHETYVVSVNDIHAFETQHEIIAADSFVIIRTGWDNYWNDTPHYHNNLVFPSVSVEAARLLLERNIVGLGIDTLSPDSPHNKFAVHQLLLGAGKYIVENVANTDKLPPTGSWCLIAPLKIAGGTEAPVRLIGMIKKT